MRQVAGSDAKLFGIEGDIVGHTIMTGYKAYEGIVEVDGTPVLLLAVTGINYLRVNEVVGIANGSGHVVAHSQTCRNRCGKGSGYAVP